jgi:hypothetical protein
VQWLAEVEAAIPSVVVEVHTISGPVFDVAVKIDGVARLSALDGRPIELDPGVHAFEVERPGAPPITQRVTLLEGQKNRLVLVDWPSPPSPLSHLPEPALGPDAARLRARIERPVPVSAFVAVGISALGFAGFAIAGTWANGLKSDLERSGCAPFCSRDQADALRTRYVFADIGLAIGIAELATSAFIFLTRPERPL